MPYLNRKDFYWMIPSVLILGAILSVVQLGNWFIGWISFSFLFLISFLLLNIFTKWSGNKTLIWIVALAFFLRFAGGVITYLTLPILGYEDEDDQAGYIYTDAHRRDDQAWELANSD